VLLVKGRIIPMGFARLQRILETGISITETGSGEKRFE
jgi:hypothetical protein